MFRTFFSYIRDSIGELSHVTWPTRREVMQHTIIIISSVAIATVIIAAIDFGLNFLIKELLLKSGS